MTKTELKWRLGKLPTPEEVTKLLEKELITKEEAREILFKEEVNEERDVTSYKEEIKFLRELVDKLSNDRGKITEVIKYIQPHYTGSWTTPYIGWTSTSGSSAGAGNTLTYATASNSLAGDGTVSAVYCDSSGMLTALTSGTGNFSDIETF